MDPQELVNLEAPALINILKSATESGGTDKRYGLIVLLDEAPQAATFHQMMGRLVGATLCQRAKEIAANVYALDARHLSNMVQRSPDAAIVAHMKTLDAGTSVPVFVIRNGSEFLTSLTVEYRATTGEPS